MYEQRNPLDKFTPEQQEEIKRRNQKADEPWILVTLVFAGIVLWIIIASVSGYFQERRLLKEEEKNSPAQSYELPSDTTAPHLDESKLYIK